MITVAKVLKEFRTVIVPGVTNQSLKSLLSDPDFNVTIRVSVLFSDYVVGLEDVGLIDSKLAEKLDLAWVKLLEKANS